MQRNDPYKELHRQGDNTAAQEAYKLQRADSHDYDDPSDGIMEGAREPGNAGTESVVIPAKLFNTDTIAAISNHLYLHIFPGTTLKAGKYLNDLHRMTFILDHDLVNFGKLDCSIVNRENAPVLKCLLDESLENQFFRAGRHIIAERNQDGEIIKYNYIVTEHDLVVRKDKYSHMVCDVISKDCLGSGGFGGVYAVLGSLKERVYEPSGIKYEPNGERRLLKLVIQKNVKPDDEFDFEASKEISITRLCPHLGSRHTFFAKTSSNQKMYGMSIRRFKAVDLTDFVNDQQWDKKKFDYDILLQISIQLFEKLKTQIHDKGIIHRDIKPENVLISNRGALGYEAEIIDLGCAKIVGSLDFTNAGSFHFAAPERFYEGAGYQASDIYAMALVVGILWGDQTQRKMIQMDLDEFIQDRQDCGWKLNFDLFTDMATFPRECRKMLLAFLQSATHEAAHRRPKIDECIQTLKNIRQRYLERIADDKKIDDLKLVNQAAGTARAQMNNYARLPLSKDNVQSLTSHLLRIIKQLPDDHVSYQAFVSSLGVECLRATPNKAALTSKIEDITKGFFTMLDRLAGIQKEMNELLGIIVESKKYDNDERLLNFFKEVNHLSSFRKTMMETPLALQDLHKQTEHMYSKLRKMMQTKKALQDRYADVLKNPAPQTSSLRRK